MDLFAHPVLGLACTRLGRRMGSHLPFSLAWRCRPLGCTQTFYMGGWQIPMTPARTMLGRHMDSHMPYSESGAVPATMKSLAVSIAPIVSMPARYGSDVSGSRPAMTGDTKYGPNLRGAPSTASAHKQCSLQVQVHELHHSKHSARHRTSVEGKQVVSTRSRMLDKPGTAAAACTL